MGLEYSEIAESRFNSFICPGLDRIYHFNFLILDLVKDYAAYARRIWVRVEGLCPTPL